MMRLLILSPTVFPSVTGNAMTVERWRRFLEGGGVRVRVLAADVLEPAALAREVRRFAPGVIHVHHAFRAGSLLLDPLVAPSWATLPLVVSPAGTDIHLDLGVAARREVVVTVCSRAHAIVAQGEETAVRLETLLPHLRNRVVRVPKSFSWMGDEPFDLRAAAGCGPEEFLFFLPAGIRPVKGNLECLLALERVHEARPWVRAAFAGPVLDCDYGATFLREVERLRAFARWIQPIPPQAMRAAYDAADVVLNASFAEGLSNALMEAIAAGRPVLASDIPGNRGPILGENGDAPIGCLFDPHEPDGFLRQALALIDDDILRRTLGEAGRRRVVRWSSPEVEAEALIRVYERSMESV